MRSLILVIVTILLPLSAHAQQQLLRQVYDTKTNTWVQVTSMFGKLPAYGFAPIRVELNNGTATEKKFTLQFTSGTSRSYGSTGESRTTSSFSCSCAPGKSATYDFLIPLTTLFQSSGYNLGSNLEFTITSDTYPNDSGRMETEMSPNWPTVVMSNTLYIPNASALTSHLSSSSRTSSGNLEFAGEFNPKLMPTDWRAYLGIDHVMLTSDNWRDLDPGASTAILEWVRLGGRLTIYTTTSTATFDSLQITPPAPETTTTPRAKATSIDYSMGHIFLLPLDTSKSLDPAKTLKLVSPSSSMGSPTYNSLLHDYAAKWPLLATLGEKNFNTGFFIIILFAFGILVGPVNLFVFAKSGQRHRLFITTPIISLGASALLVVLILFQDGFGGRGHRVVLMELQPSENNAYLIQEQAARTGVLLSSSFETSAPTLITPVALSPSRWSRVVLDGSTSNNYTANHGDHGLKCSGDWFQSRSTHGHLLKSVRPTRGRIKLSPKAGAPVVTSSFDFDLDALFYQAPDGSWWRTEAIKKGASVTLRPTDQRTFNQWIRGRADLFSKFNAQQLKKLSRQPGRFYATTEQAPGIDTYKSIKWLTTTTVITGPVLK